MSPACRSASAVAVAVLAAFSLAGCTKSVADVPDANDIVRQAGSHGKSVDYYGLQAAVLRIQSMDQSPDGFPRLLVTVRSENKRSAPWQNPDVTIRCDESKGGSEWFDSSTWEPNGGLPAGQVAEGQVSLSFPTKPGASRYPVPSCTHAQVVLTGTNPENRDQKTFIAYPVDDDIVRAAFDAERGH